MCDKKDIVTFTKLMRQVLANVLLRHFHGPDTPRHRIEIVFADRAAPVLIVVVVRAWMEIDVGFDLPRSNHLAVAE
jgi:hypothetical protein